MVVAAAAGAAATRQRAVAASRPPRRHVIEITSSEALVRGLAERNPDGLPAQTRGARCLDGLLLTATRQYAGRPKQLHPIDCADRGQRSFLLRRRPSGHWDRERLCDRAVEVQEVLQRSDTG